MEHLLRALAALERDDPAYAQAIANVRADIRSDASPHGNLGPHAVTALDAACELGRGATEAISEHQAIVRPDLHQPAMPPIRVRRALARSDFVVYQVIGQDDDSAEKMQDRHVWEAALTNGVHRFGVTTLRGWTGRREGSCWWSFDEAGRPTPDEAHAYVAELALSARTASNIADEHVVVEVSLPAAVASARYFKPSALEGFGPDTRFRPELSGAAYGRTVPDDGSLRGWPEVVSASAAYSDILGENDEVEVRVLPY